MSELMSTEFHATTICAVQRDGKTAIAGDGQVTMGNAVIMKGTAQKVRRLYHAHAPQSDHDADVAAAAQRPVAPPGPAAASPSSRRVAMTLLLRSASCRALLAASTQRSIIDEARKTASCLLRLIKGLLVLTACMLEMKPPAVPTRLHRAACLNS